MKDMLGSFAYDWLRKGIDKMAAIYWLIGFVVLLGIEAATMALTTIWFAGGALAAFILALLGAGVEVQLAVFVIVSFALLFFTRPFALKYVNRNTVKTNSESLIGKHAKVTAEVNNMEGTGAAVLNGQECRIIQEEYRQQKGITKNTRICPLQRFPVIQQEQ